MTELFTNSTVIAQLLLRIHFIDRTKISVIVRPTESIEAIIKKICKVLTIDPSLWLKFGLFVVNSSGFEIFLDPKTEISAVVGESNDAVAIPLLFRLVLDSFHSKHVLQHPKLCSLVIHRRLDTMARGRLGGRPEGPGELVQLYALHYILKHPASEVPPLDILDSVLKQEKPPHWPAASTAAVQRQILEIVSPRADRPKNWTLAGDLRSRFLSLTAPFPLTQYCSIPVLLEGQQTLLSVGMPGVRLVSVPSYRLIGAWAWPSVTGWGSSHCHFEMGVTEGAGERRIRLSCTAPRGVCVLLDTAVRAVREESLGVTREEEAQDND
eukprot:gnl/Dysnectes_brevis/8867_a16096_113.p1 GENE.gnl/Dysnectes_brevis/8867_a16096_113~~gnl/Dysnectes_brevis/8867_a16096_113.p1  ORF type:complete len:324 (+),score=93.01 gnl/Dysnectes_brevis/8867_a16096_113:30-1001(+)